MPELLDFEKAEDSQSRDIGPEQETSEDQYLGFSDITPSCKESLKTILDKVTIAEEFYRYRQLRGLKRNNLFWHGYTNIVWNGPNDLAGDWVSVADAMRNLGSDELKMDPSLYDDTVAVYRAYGESIVGALASQPPSVRFFPQNADTINDIRTASAYSRISKKIQQDNKTEVIMPAIVKTLYNEGLVGIYNYSQYDEKYGSVTRDVYGQSEVKVINEYCPNCNALTNSDVIEEEAHDLTDGANLTNSEILQQPLKEEFGEDGLLADPNQDPNQEQIPEPPKMIECPECGYQGPGQTEEYNETIPIKKDSKEIPKCRQILEVYGAVQIQISMFADKPQDVGSLILYSEAHYGKMRDLFPWIRNEIQPGDDQGKYYRWSRQFTGLFDEQQSQCTVRRMWLRPWMYEILDDEERRNELKEKFPAGVYTVFVNDVFAQAFDEDLDEHWTLTLHPLSEKIYADPLGKFCLPIQRMVDDVTSLTMDTIKHGIGITFADPRYFAFEKFGQTQSLPGAVYPMQTPPSGNINNAFGQIKTANLSQEVGVFTQRLDFYGQFVTGALPAIFGGATEATLGQSDLNKQQALQRLGISWLVIKVLWATVMSKATKQYADALLEDEAITEKIGSSYINSVIRLEDLQGKVGEVTPEASENFPITWGQKRQTYMELFKLQNEQLTAILGMNENAAKVTNAIGIDELYIPGDDQRNKQLDEISELIRSQPIPGMILGQFQSSVPIEPQVDDDQVHIQTCMAFVAGEMGQDLKRFNPAGYQNVLAHVQEHQMNLQMIMMQQQQEQMAQEQEQGFEQEQEQS